MKKTLVALAALAATASFAQSSVTLYGTMDASFASQTSDGVTTTGQRDSGISSSVWGLRGSEDLGGGLRAIFNAESDVNTATGQNSLNGNGAPTAAFTGTAGTANTQTGAYTPAGTVAVSGGTTDTMFRRAANVGIAGNFGEVTLGRRISPNIANSQALSVMGGNSVGTTNQQVQGTTASFFTKNAITYVSPSLAGFVVTLQSGLVGDSATLQTDGSKYATTAGSIAYANGPLSAGLATQTINDAAGARAQTNTSGRVSYALGAVTVGLGSQSSKNAADVTNTSNVYSVAYKANDSLTVGGTYIASDIGGSLTNLQARYSLSKRTTVYLQAASAQADKGGTGFSTLWTGTQATNTNNSSAYALGVIHSF